MKIYKPDMGAIREEAKRIRDSSDGGFLSRELKYMEFEWGDNTFRICPPYNARGQFAKCVKKHFELYPKRLIMPCLHTWPDKFSKCPICDSIERVYKRLPTVDLKRQEPSSLWNLNVVNREKQDDGVLILTITNATYNRIILLMDNPKIGDITDPDNGLDIMIRKTKKKDKNGKVRTNYGDPQTIPDRCALGASDALTEEYLTQLYNLDQVYGPPKDAKIAEVRQAAEMMERYYFHREKASALPREDADFYDDYPEGVEDVPEDPPPRTNERQRSGESQRSGDSQRSDARGDDFERRTRERTARNNGDAAASAPAPQSDGFERRTTSRQATIAANSSVANPEDDLPDFDAPRTSRTTTTTKRTTTTTRRSDASDFGTAKESDAATDDTPKMAAKNVNSLDDVKPRSFPDCYAGHDDPVPHSDGTIGYNEKIRKCQVCRYEMNCLDKKLERE